MSTHNTDKNIYYSKNGNARFWLKLKWFFERNKVQYKFCGTQEQLDTLLAKRKWYEHKNYVLDENYAK